MRRLINIADKRTEFVVEIGLIPLRAELRSVIDTRDTGHREQQRIEIAQILLIPERRTGALDIMIVHKIQEIFSREERPRRRGKQAGHVVLDLKKVPGIVRREHAAEPLIIGNGVKALGADVLLKIVGVDNFADQEKIWFLLIDRATQQLHKPRRKQVTHIQPQPVDPEFIDPETHSIHQIVLHILIIETQLDQLRMPFPVFIVQPVVIGGITAEINVEPKTVIRPLTLLQNFPKGRERPSDVIEHAVKHDTNADRMKRRNERFEFFVGPEASVDLVKIHRVIAVTLTLEKRIEQNGTDPQFL